MCPFELFSFFWSSDPLSDWESFSGSLVTQVSLPPQWQSVLPGLITSVPNPELRTTTEPETGLKVVSVLFYVSTACFIVFVPESQSDSSSQKCWSLLGKRLRVKQILVLTTFEKRCLETSVCILFNFISLKPQSQDCKSASMFSLNYGEKLSWIMYSHGILSFRFPSISKT